MTLKTFCGILLVLTLVQHHFTVSSGTSTSEFSILPNSNSPCPMKPCYTLSQVMDNPSNYFISNTTAVFPPGHHEISTEGQLVIQNVNNISLVGDNDNTTTIKCTGQFGLAFINITNLNVSKLYFSMCGAPISNPSWLKTCLYKISYIRSTSSFPSLVIIYLLQITNLTATRFGISHSKGIGLLGSNIFGVSSIQQAVFVNNTPNCVIIFLDSYSLANTPVLHVTDSLVMFGLKSDDNKLAAGLNIVAVQTTYLVNISIRNVTAYGNAANNMRLRVNCRVAIQMIQINSTSGDYYGLTLKMKGNSTNCKSQVIFHILHSYFGGNIMGASLYFHSTTCCVHLKLENITVENNARALEVSMNPSSILVMNNVNIKHNTGPLWIWSFGKSSLVEFHGTNIIKNSAYSALHLKHCNVTFYGNTTFLHNRSRYHGGAIYAENVEINFQGSVMFLENRGEYGGAMMLYRNVSVVIGQFAEVSFVRNHAQESGGAVYARDSQIIISTEQRISFVENEGYNGGALTLDGGSIIYLEANSVITFERNHAYNCGGAIYCVDDYHEDYADLSKCFYGILSTDIWAEYATSTLIDTFDYMKMIHFSIQFYNNTAGFAGTAVYGGWIDLCKFHFNYQMILNLLSTPISLASVVDNLFHFTSPHNNCHSYLLIQHVYVCVLTCPSLTAVSLNTLSQPILERH